MVIVAAIDRTERAAKVIEEADSLATAYGDPVHVVNVLRGSEFVDAGTRRAEEGRPMDMDEARDMARRTAEEAAADLEAPHEAVGRIGNPAVEVVDYAEKHDARFVVVARRKRSPSGKAVFGSVTQSIILDAPCPVVSVL